MGLLTFLFDRPIVLFRVTATVAGVLVLGHNAFEAPGTLLEATWRDPVAALPEVRLSDGRLPEMRAANRADQRHKGQHGPYGIYCHHLSLNYGGIIPDRRLARERRPPCRSVLPTQEGPELIRASLTISSYFGVVILPYLRTGMGYWGRGGKGIHERQPVELAVLLVPRLLRSGSA